MFSQVSVILSMRRDGYAWSQVPLLGRGECVYWAGDGYTSGVEHNRGESILGGGYIRDRYTGTGHQSGLSKLKQIIKFLSKFLYRNALIAMLQL